jgi:hypothetical protein
MKMKTIAIGFALLVLTTSALAGNDDRRPQTSGHVVWSTRDRDGNQFGIVFQFGQQRVYGGHDRYDRNDRYDRDGRYNDHYRYDRRDFRSCPPVYDYKKYRGRDYDHRYFDSFEEWTDWRQWMKHWSKRKNWQRDSRERSRAWQAFQYERNRAYDRWQRGDDRYDRDDRYNKGRRD